MEEFAVRTDAKCGVVDITSQVEGNIRRRGSACLVYVPHTTCGITINEFEPNIEKDYPEFFSRLAPAGNYRHNRIDDNAEAHLLSAVLKPSVVVPLRDGRLALGTWQRILLVEGDGPRTRTVYVQVLE